MGIADWALPGRRRRNLALSIDGVAEAARSGAAEPDERRARLWELLCESSRETLRQLLIKSDDKRMDWGVRSHIRRIDDARLVVLFQWALLYQIALFKDRGLEGYDPSEEVGAMSELARRFAVEEFERLGMGTDPPGAWSEDWERQVGLEAAMGFYDSIYALLGLHNDPIARIERVSHFTTLTERAHDRLKNG